ncbi:MAG: hypothetical protein EAZ57_05415 [Cytophagales bacterium]|nr:MAG: hypothetical protein EAZ67_06165 [Cytophagales bacterium]TAF60984.1 MAG: hypothetical protein EAZ57_05415 [Cytophagales bacterium]
MKLLKLFFVFAFVMIAQAQAYSTQSINSDPSTQHYRIRFVARWAGVDLNGNGQTCPCPGCRCPSCPCPLGVCTCFTSSLLEPNQSLASDEGAAEIWMENGLLKIKFLQTTAVVVPSIGTNAVVPISGAPGAYFELSSQVAALLGYQSVKVAQGFYVPDYTNSQYGTITVTPILN